MSETQTAVDPWSIQPRVNVSPVDVVDGRQFVEGLLESYLQWAAAFTLQKRISDLAQLPSSCAGWIEHVMATNLPWVAWDTDRGLVTATGRYDHAQSLRTGYWVLYIEWSLPPHTRNGSWWRSDPRRPREWTSGAGRPASQPP